MEFLREDSVSQFSATASEHSEVDLAGPHDAHLDVHVVAGIRTSVYPPKVLYLHTALFESCARSESSLRRREGVPSPGREPVES